MDSKMREAKKSLRIRETDRDNPRDVFSFHWNMSSTRAFVVNKFQSSSTRSIFFLLFFFFLSFIYTHNKLNSHMCVVASAKMYGILSFFLRNVYIFGLFYWNIKTYCIAFWHETYEWMNEYRYINIITIHFIVSHKFVLKLKLWI